MNLPIPNFNTFDYKKSVLNWERHYNEILNIMYNKYVDKNISYDDFVKFMFDNTVSYYPNYKSSGGRPLI
jgi:hypothetical protein